MWLIDAVIRQNYMPCYNFDAISPADFEELTRNLLQAEWGVRIESFRTGRDRGIDLRYAPIIGNATIIQCKHYAQSGFRKLLSDLRKNELPKVRVLGPSRYVIATTLRLTPSNKAAIATAMAPFLADESQDILAGDDIEAMLSRHPNVERASFKLWLTSTSVLENVLHNAERCRTDFEVDRVKRKLPLFVQNDTFAQAREMLERNSTLVISGPPGIGKTTLAEMLLFMYLENGYEPVVVESSIKEGRKFHRQNEKQVFYFDDFLGQTFLGDSRDYLGSNQDRALVDFMEMVHRSEHARFILTTREHIFQNAIHLSERLGHSHVLRERIVLTMQQYAFGHRARMLYNHVYFSELSNTHKIQITSDDFFLKIIGHRHFNPRLVEWLTSISRVRSVAPENYRAFIQALLDDPAQLWGHAFRNQISEEARSALFCLYSVGEQTVEIDLEPAFEALHRVRAQRYNFRTTSNDFRNSLRELDGAFLSFSRGYIGFLNPGVKDFIAGVIVEQRLAAEDIFQSAVRIKQIKELWSLSKIHSKSIIATLFQSTNPLLHERIEQLADGPNYRSYSGDAGRIYYQTVDLSYGNRILFIADMIDHKESESLAHAFGPILKKILNTLSNEYASTWTLKNLLEEINQKSWYLEHGGEAMRRDITDRLISAADLADSEEWDDLLDAPATLEHLTETDKKVLRLAFERYKSEGVHRDIRSASEIDDKKSLASNLEALETKSGHSFRIIINRLEEEISESEEEEESSDSDTRLRETPASVAEGATEEQVREMFRSLAL